MSMDQLEKFRQQLNDDEELQRKVSAALNQEVDDDSDDDTDDGIDLKVLADIAQQEGYDFTVEEAEQVLSSLVGNEGGEVDLTDYELELIAGGWGPWRRRRRRRGSSRRRRSGGGSARTVSTLEI